MVAELNSLDVRPYQLLCVICRQDGGGKAPCPFPAKLDEIEKLLRKSPWDPITLRCNVESNYEYQNPGRAEDTPEGALYNDLRDLRVLQKLGLVPGATRPAIDLYERVFKKIESVENICGVDEKRENWTSCPLAKSGCFEAGLEKGLNALIPMRGEKEKHAVKCSSCRDIGKAEILEIRPHHLLCMACFYGDGTDFSPIEEDNLHEVIARAHENPDIPIKLIPGPCMICPPCSKYIPAINKCVGAQGMGVRDQKKDLETLQALDLKYGDVLPARELFKLLFERIKSTTEICGGGTGEETSPEWAVCGGPNGNQDYPKAAARGLGIPATKK